MNVLVVTSPVASSAISPSTSYYVDSYSLRSRRRPSAVPITSYCLVIVVAAASYVLPIAAYLLLLLLLLSLLLLLLLLLLLNQQPRRDE
jgi:hypothetical protein